MTGATGFVGRWLVRELLARGQSVRVLARDPAKARRLFGDRVDIHPGPLDQPTPLARAFRGAETVFHCAGLYRFGWGHTPELRRSNITTTGHVLEGFARSGARRLVHVSTAGLLHAPSGGLIRESDFPARRPLGCAYKASKWEAERLVLAAAARGLPACIASPTCPIGPEDETPTPTGAMVLDFLQGRFPCSMRTGLNLLHVRDLARGLAQAGALGRPGQRYVLGHSNLWLGEILEMMAAASGLEAPRLELPWPVLALAALPGELAHLWSPHRSRRICLETACQARRCQFYTMAATQGEIEWTPRLDVPTALAESMAWFGQTLPAPAVQHAHG